MKTIPYTMTIDGQPYIIDDAQQLAPGLALFRLPDTVYRTDPRRWRVGHLPSGLAIAGAMRREDAVRGIRALAKLTDWTRDSETVKASVITDEVFTTLLAFDCCLPGTDRMDCNVSHNGTYTDEDIEKAARAAADEQMDGLELLHAMAHTVPWMGLDTEPFNEAHSRILAIACPDEVAA
ncbi:hypothetical protein ACIGO8_08315 [Streptomyces sp. NPDC053493]|uniref:hypothetical protein n=1 Tax=Streptomyces sp. NPDC053493 TaxID=3365705 RepID=UPI0037D4EC80